MTTRRTTALTVVAALGCVLAPSGVALLASGVSGDSDGRTVAGILFCLTGLVCFRVLFWARRIRMMTQAGLALHADDDSSDERGTARP